MNEWIDGRTDGQDIQMVLGLESSSAIDWRLYAPHMDHLELSSAVLL